MKVLNKYKQLIVGSVVAVVILLGGVTLLTSLSRQQENQIRQTAAVGSERKEYIAYTAQKGKTALAQLKQVSRNVTTKTSSFGEYVESIGKLKGGDGGKYWTFYVDGKMASAGAGAYVAKGGEKIEWKFEKTQ